VETRHVQPLGQVGAGRLVVVQRVGQHLDERGEHIPRTHVPILTPERFAGLDRLCSSWATEPVKGRRPANGPAEPWVSS